MDSPYFYLKQLIAEAERRHGSILFSDGPLAVLKHKIISMDRDVGALLKEQRERDAVLAEKSQEDGHCIAYSIRHQK